MSAPWKRTVAVALLGLSWHACEKANEPTPRVPATQKMATVPEITAEVEADGFQDLVFALTGTQDLADGSQRLTAEGIHEGTPVQLQIDLGSKWKGGRLADSLTSYQGSVRLRSTGPGSDALLKVMDSLYGTHLSPVRMGPSTEFAAISLEGDPARLHAGPVKLKLFFESDDEDKYAELYLNIESERSRLYLNEKDPEYRQAVILALEGAKR